MEYRAGETLLLRCLGSGPILRIIDFFLDNPLSEYSKSEVGRNLDMNRQTFSEYFDFLEQVGIVKVSRAIGKARLYKIDRSSPMVKTITEFEKKLSTQIADREESKMKRPVAVT